MVAQYLEHTAIRSLSAAALMHHPLQFRPQRLEPRQSLLDLFELPTGYCIRLSAGLSRMIAESPIQNSSSEFIALRAAA